jgi:replicative DNA helicase|nr:MAG TPA_asm: Helicase, ATPase, REPLICATION [Caudoviricetes sp.]
MAKIVSVKAELNVLRGLCHADKSISGTLLASVDVSYFYDEQSKELYENIKKHIQTSGSQPTYRTIIEDPEITQSARDFFRQSAADIQSVDEAKKAASVLNKYRQLRCLFELSSQVSTSLESGKLDVEKMIESASDLIMEARVTKQANAETLRFGKGNNSTATIKDILYGENKDDLIPTGYKTYDDVNGGFARGGLTIIGGSTGAGKSVMAIDLAAKQAAMGYRVVVVPLEMTRRELTARLIANVTKTDALLINQNHKLNQTERDVAYKKMVAWTKKIAKIGGAVYIYEPDRDITIDEIYAEVSTYNPDVVIIDYISLLAGADGDNQWQELGKMARIAKVNAKATNRVNILLCQVNAEGVVRYSRTMVEHANSAWVFVATQETKEAGILKIEQQKARSGRAFPFTMKIDYATMRISDMPHGEDADIALGNSTPSLPMPISTNLGSDL